MFSLEFPREIGTLKILLACKIYISTLSLVPPSRLHGQVEAERDTFVRVAGVHRFIKLYLIKNLQKIKKNMLIEEFIDLTVKVYVFISVGL